MKKVLFGLFGVVSLAGLVACGNPTPSTGDISESPDTGTTIDSEAGQAVPEDMPVGEEMPMGEEMPVEEDMPVGEDMSVDTPELSDSDLEMTIQENLATLYPDTSFEVEAEAGSITIAGDIASQEEVDYITEWVSEMEGVTSVDVQSAGAESLP